jgi:dihydropyrimidine dehydrogenase (NAD+) subunit PreA
MVKKSFEAGWGGVFFKTVGLFIPDECSPRFDITTKESTPWLGFKNMEQISDKPTALNFQFMAQLKKDFPTKVIVASIMGDNENEWRILAKMCEDAGVDLIEGNFSCPQMTRSSMGADVGTSPELVTAYTRAVTETTKIPFVAKMTPNITSMIPPALAAIEAGAAGVSTINTIKSITNIDLNNMAAMPVVDGKSSISGYSGAAVKPIALRFVTELMQHEKLKHYDLSGIGGIETWEDCAEFLLLGCRNLQVTTSVMQYGYRIVEDMANGLMHLMDEHGYEKIDDFVGKALGNIIPAEDINRSFKVLPKIKSRQCIGCGRCYLSCSDGGHQALGWDEERRLPKLIPKKCVGCQLCRLVCPVNCIESGKVVVK